MIKTYEIKDYKGYGKCLVITNGVIEAYATLDIGPRIVRFGFIDRCNVCFDEKNTFAPKTDAEFEKYYYKNAVWNNYGGHRLWVSPEYYPQTYFPANDPVEYELTATGAIFTQVPQTQNGVALSIELKMDPDDANMQVIHNVKNISNHPMEFAPWSITVCARDGIEIIPLNTNDTGYLNNKIIAVWPYTDMQDERVFWCNRYVTIHQKNIDCALKLGFDNNSGTAYYVVEDTVFRKSYSPDHLHLKYPDGGVSFETYSCKDFTEVETLGELKTVLQGETSTHIESWSLINKPCELNERDEKSIDEFIEKL